MVLVGLFITQRGSLPWIEYVLIWLRGKLITTVGEESVSTKCDPRKESATLSSSCPFPLNSLLAPNQVGPFQERKEEGSDGCDGEIYKFSSYVRHLVSRRP